MLCPHAKFGGDLPPHGGERGKIGVFCLFCVCLSRLRSVYLWTVGALTVRAILLPFIGRFRCTFQRFLEQETPCRIFQTYLNYVISRRHICLGIRSKFGNVSKFERQSLFARLRPFRRIEKFYHSLLAQGL